MSGNKHIKQDVLQYFRERPGKTVYLAAIAKALGVDEFKVQTCVGHIRREWEQNKSDFPLETIQAGQIWMHSPHTASVNGSKSSLQMPMDETDTDVEKFEFVGTTKDGDTILRSPEGALFKATEL